MQISDIVVKFINKRKKMLEEGEWERLYDEAYEYLSQDHIQELTAVLKRIEDPKTIDVVIADVIRDKIEDEVYNFVQDGKEYIKLVSFVNLYFNSRLGLSQADFDSAVVSYVDHKYYDGVYVDWDEEDELALYHRIK